MWLNLYCVHYALYRARTQARPCFRHHPTSKVLLPQELRKSTAGAAVAADVLDELMPRVSTVAACSLHTEVTRVADNTLFAEVADASVLSGQT